MKSVLRVQDTEWILLGLGMELIPRVKRLIRLIAGGLDNPPFLTKIKVIKGVFRKERVVTILLQVSSIYT